MKYFRVYKNGTKSPTLEGDMEALGGLIEYNKVMRFGCAQFLDGKCIYKGYLSDEEVKKVEEEFLAKSSR